MSAVKVYCVSGRCRYRAFPGPRELVALFLIGREGKQRKGTRRKRGTQRRGRGYTRGCKILTTPQPRSRRSRGIQAFNYGRRILLVSGKPFPVRNCTLANQTYTSVEVKCVAGYDGGLPQKFILEVYHGDVDFLVSSQPLYNVSNIEEPSFSLAGLEASVDAGVHVAVYAVNAKGRSQPVILSEVTYRDAEKRTGESSLSFER